MIQPLTRVLALVCIATGLMAGVVYSDEPASATANPEDRQEAEKSGKRLEFLTKATGRFELKIRGEEEQVSRLTPEPLLRWTNPHSSAKDGLLIAFTRGGRPDVLAQIAIYSDTNVVHEFQSTCEHPLALSRDERVMWEWDQPGVEFKTLENDSAPAGSETLRTAQFRQIAESFQVFDDHGWTEPVRQPLRLLRQPLLRYQDEQAGIIDGAVFGLVLGTDPEAILLLEAFKSETGPQWRYAFAEMTIYKLQAFRNEELAWEKPDRRVFCRSHVAHYVCPYSFASDDIPLKGLLPSDKVPATSK